MRRCLAAGLTPQEFWDLSFEESLLVIKAYEDRMNMDWQHTRLMVYTIACTVTPEEKRTDIYDLFYIPGDPTPEERLAAEKKQYDRMKADLKAFNEELRRELQNKKNGN